jgi:DNA-binding GntR family transcriptional regulator
MLDDEALERIAHAARACEDAVEAGDVVAELAANRRFHLAIFDAPGQPHTLRLIKQVWDSTEAYRAMYYNAPEERMASLQAHERILAAVYERNPDLLVKELDEHRERALHMLRHTLAGA